MSAIRAEAADMFNLGGSVESAQAMAAMAEAAGMPVWLQVVGLGLGISGAGTPRAFNYTECHSAL